MSNKYTEPLKKVNWTDKIVHILLVVVPLIGAGFFGFHKVASHWEDIRTGIGNVQEDVKSVGIKIDEVRCAQQSLSVRMKNIDFLSEYTVNDEINIHEVSFNLGIPPETLKDFNLHIPNFSSLEHGTVIVYNSFDEGTWP